MKRKRVTIYCKFRESDGCLLGYTLYAPANDYTEKRMGWLYPNKTVTIDNAA